MSWLDLTGRKLGKWTVLSRAAPQVAPSGHAFTRWLCRCECGTVREVDTSRLRSRPGGCQGCSSPGRPRAEWTAERAALLGTATDAEVASALGCGANAVRKERRRRGVPAFRRPAAPPPADDQLTDQRRKEAARLRREGRTFAQIGEALGVSAERARQLLRPRRPRKQRADAWTAREDALVGTVSDAEAAGALGRSVDAVRARRRQLGVASAVPPGRPKGAKDG